MSSFEKSYLEYKRRMCLAMNYIVRHLDENPTLDEIAEAAFFSKYHFHRLFHAAVGETVAQFTRRIRLEKAANLLIYDRNRDITTIAHLCGFSSSQNFAKAFRKHFSLSPTEFKKQNSKNGNSKSKNGNDISSSPGYIADQLTGLFTTTSNNRREQMDVDVKEMPEYHVGYVRQIGPYGPEGCGAAFETLMSWAGPRGFAASGLSIGISWDNPEVTPPAKCRYDACITIPKGTEVEGEIGTQSIPGGLYAVYRCRIKTDEFGQAWQDLFGKWLPQSGYQPDERPCYELCHTNPEAEAEADNRWLVEICCPVKPL